MSCDRCHQESRASIGSMFNTQQICLACKRREEAHPAYEKALEAEGEAVRNGDMNFPGIGLPADL